MKWMLAGFVAVACVGCGGVTPEQEDGGEDVVMVTTQSELDALCADPASAEGARVRLDAGLVEEFAECTLADCGQACCNACEVEFVARCGSDTIRLTAAEGYTEAVTYDRENPGVSSDLYTLIQGFSSPMGCVGPDCDYACTHDLDAVATFEATFTTTPPSGYFESTSNKGFLVVDADTPR